MDDIIKKIGMSSNPVIRQLANIPRFVIRFFLFRLLRHRKNKAIVQLIKKIQSERGFMMWPDEMVFLATCAKTVTNVRGHIAEVGVASAGSAKLLAEFKGNKELHLFDTFEGLPETKKIDGALRKGQYKYSLEEINEHRLELIEKFGEEREFDEILSFLLSKLRIVKNDEKIRMLFTGFGG